MEDEIKVNWPQDAKPLTGQQIKPQTPIMSADLDNQDDLAYVTFEQLSESVKEIIEITGQEIAPLVGGDTSGTALSVPEGPEGEVRTADVASGKWYNFGSGPVQATADKRWRAFWNGTTWSLVDMGGLPDTNIANWEQGTYSAGQQVHHKGYLWEVIAGTTTEEPELGSSDWRLVLYITLKENTANVAWGIADNTPDKNVVFYIDNVGKAIFNASEKATVSFANIKEQEETEKFDWGVSDNTPNRNLILGIKDGKIWTKNGIIDPSKIHPTTPTESSVFFTNNEDFLLPSDSSPNGIYNQWVEPMMVTDKDGVTFFTSIGMNGEIFLHAKRKDGLIRRKIIGTAEVDDHNGAAILLDDRDGADFPLMIFQSNHQTTPMKWCKLNSKNPDNWNNIEWNNMDGGNVSYAQSFRYGDEIIVHCRTARRSEPEGDTRGIRWYYSSDNGDTWVYKTVFETLGVGDLYFQLKEKADKSGLNISINAHPLVHQYTGMRFINFDWSSGTISATIGGTPIVEDFREIFTDDDWQPLDEFEIGLEVVPENTESNRRRMIDITNNSNGETKLLYAYFPVNGNTLTAYRSAVFRVVSFDINTGVINYDISLGECGMPWERPAGGNLYISLGCFIDQKRVLLGRYRNQAYIDGGTSAADTAENDGYTDFRAVVINSDTDITTYDHVAIKEGKAGRPYKSIGGDYIMSLQEDNYTSYTEFDSNIFLLNIKNIKTWA